MSENKLNNYVTLSNVVLTVLYNVCTSLCHPCNMFVQNKKLSLFTQLKVMNNVIAVIILPSENLLGTFLCGPVKCLKPYLFLCEFISVLYSFLDG